MGGRLLSDIPGRNFSVFFSDLIQTVSKGFVPSSLFWMVLFSVVFVLISLGS